MAGSTEMRSDCLDPALAAEVLRTLQDVPDARGVLVGRTGAYIQRDDDEAFAWIHAYVPPLTLVDGPVDAVELLLERGDGVLSVGTSTTGLPRRTRWWPCPTCGTAST